jgi:hypothetical protein
VDVEVIRQRMIHVEFQYGIEGSENFFGTRLRLAIRGRGSAVECAPCLGVSVAKRITKSDRIRSDSLHARDFEHEHEESAQAVRRARSRTRDGPLPW